MKTCLRRDEWPHCLERLVMVGLDGNAAVGSSYCNKYLMGEDGVGSVVADFFINLWP